MSGTLELAPNGYIARPRPKGRPSAYTHELGVAICEKIARGITRQAAAESMGVSRDTLQEWQTVYVDFSVMVMRADAEAEIAYSEALLAAATDTANAKGDGKLCVEWLKRRRRADYGDTLDVRKVDTSQLLELFAAAAHGQQDAITEDSVPMLTAGDEDI